MPGKVGIGAGRLRAGTEDQAEAKVTHNDGVSLRGAEGRPFLDVPLTAVSPVR